MNQRAKTIAGFRIDGSPVILDAQQLVWRPSAYALIFDARGRLLLLDNHRSGKKDFPGGGVELHETITEALAREVWEETGLTVSVGRLLHAGEAFFLTQEGHHWHTILHFYRATVSGGALRGSIIDDEPSVNPHWFDPAGWTAGGFTVGAAGDEALRLALSQA